MQLCPRYYAPPSAVKTSFSILDGCKKLLKNSKRPRTRVILHDRHRKHTYTPSSTVSGRVAIDTQGKATLEHIDVYLIGSTTTSLDRLDIAKITRHCFLRLDMPVPTQISLNGTHDIPFTFTIPESLQPSVCRSSTSVTATHPLDHHLCLPPTMTSTWDNDDMSPVMARIEYRIVARAQFSIGSQRASVETSQPIHVLPVSGEAPPLDIRGSDELYNLTKSTMLKTPLATGPSGKLSVSACQPRAISLSPDTKTATTSSARLKLRFQAPNDGLSPPSAIIVSSRITAFTHYSSDHVDCLPNLDDCRARDTTHRHETYSTSMRGFSASISNIDWKRQTETQIIKAENSWKEIKEKGTWREEKEHLLPAYHNEEINPDGTNRRAGAPEVYPVVFTTEINVPILLPTDKKTFIPSFHSCIVSRYYILKVNLTLGRGLTATTITLALPLEIVVQRPE